MKTLAFLLKYLFTIGGVMSSYGDYSYRKELTGFTLAALND